MPVSGGRSGHAHLLRATADPTLGKGYIVTIVVPPRVSSPTALGPPTHVETGSATLPPSVTVAGRTVTVRMVTARDEIVTIRLLLRCVSTDLDEIRYSDRTIGYVQRAGRVFVALTGARADRAEECGQYLLWDQAAIRLVSVLPTG